MQLIKCTPWSTRLCPHPTIIKKMKTFLGVEGKIGPIPQPTSSQYRPSQLDTNHKVRKDNNAEKRKRAAPTKRVRPSTAPKPGKAAMQQPATASKVPEAPENRPPPLEKAQVCKGSPWSGAGRISGNLFEDRNWLLPPNCYVRQCGSSFYILMSLGAIAHDVYFFLFHTKPTQFLLIFRFAVPCSLR